MTIILEGNEAPSHLVYGVFTVSSVVFFQLNTIVSLLMVISCFVVHFPRL